mgnify:CR=1 FL=1
MKTQTKFGKWGLMLATLFFALSTSSCKEGFIYEGEGDCGVYYNISFKYDYNMKFADALEKATLSTSESGKMTKDLALITTLENVEVLSSLDFIKAVRSTLEAM